MMNERNWKKREDILKETQNLIKFMVDEDNLTFDQWLIEIVNIHPDLVNINHFFISGTINRTDHFSLGKMKFLQ